MTEPTFDAAALTVTFKGSPNADAPWLVVRGNDVDQVKSLLEAADNNDLHLDIAKGAFSLQEAYAKLRPAPVAGPQMAAGGQGNGERPPLTGQAQNGSQPQQGQADSNGRVWLKIPYGKHTDVKAAVVAAGGKMFFKKEEAPDKDHVWYVQPQWFPNWSSLRVEALGKTLGEML